MFFLGGGQPHPNFCLFLENSLFRRKCFPLRSDVFFERKIWFFQKWGFSGFCPHRHISAVFELWPTKFWCHVALPECFPKVLQYVDQSSSVSIKWGFSVFCTHIAVSLGNVRFFTARCPRFLVFDVKASLFDSDHAEYIDCRKYYCLIRRGRKLLGWPSYQLPMLLKIHNAFKWWNK